MKVKTTETMKHFIAKSLKGLECVAGVRTIKCNENGAMLYGADSRDLNRNGDYQIIIVDYKPECYAMPRSITTGELTDIVKFYRVKDTEMFADVLRDEFAI